MSPEAILKLTKHMLGATQMVGIVFFLTLLFSLPLGLLACYGRMSKHWFIKQPVKLYLLVMRGTPLILQLFFFYFGPYYIFGKTLPKESAAILTCALNYAAYFAEIYRGGIESMPKGQYEAGTVLGFTKKQTFFKIILPQVAKRILPPMSNEFMTLVKDTALVSVIGVAELYQMATDNMSRMFSTAPLIIAGIFYLIMNMAVAKCFDIAEKKMSYYK